MPSKFTFVSSSDESEIENLSSTSYPPTRGHVISEPELEFTLQDQGEFLKNAEKSTMYSGETSGVTAATPCLTRQISDYQLKDDSTNALAKSKLCSKNFDILNYLSKTSGTSLKHINRHTDKNFTKKVRACSFLEDL